jgi:hypothetical protein
MTVSPPANVALALGVEDPGLPGPETGVFSV